MADRVVLPTNVVPVHYDLTISPNLETCEFGGEMSMEVTCGTANTNTVELHSKEISITSAEYQPAAEGAAAIACTGIAYDLELTKVTLKFKSALPLGAATVKVSYRGILNSDMAGFYISHYTDAEGEKRRMASTQFEALDARRAFPCVDEPNAKATFGLTLVVEKTLSALSNMPVTSTLHQKGNKKAITFDRSPKMSTYLLAWAVGEFDCLSGTTSNGVSISIYSPPGRAHQGKFALDIGKRCLDFYDSFFGTPYPLPKLDMICITEFAMGAMENWGLVTYREVDLMIDEDKASSQQLQRVATVVAHELAHQWFGNLVTMDWWDDLWLNEGFAAYMEHMSLHEIGAGFAMWEQYTVGAMASALSLDALRTSHPIQVPIAHAEEVEQVFDAISYCKGSAAVRLVNCVLGANKFREGLQNYMKQYAYGNTKTIDLWTAWSNVSGKDVADIMSTWTGQMGYPVVTLKACTVANGKTTLKLTQDWFLADGSTLSAEDKAKKWTIPLLFHTGETSSAEAVLMTEKEQTFELPGEAPFVKINAGQQVLMRVEYDTDMLAKLCEQIKNPKHLPAVDRAAILLDAYAMAKANRGTSFETVVNVLKACRNDKDYVVWKAVAGVLGALSSVMEEVGGPGYDAFQKYAATMVKDCLATVGWEAKAGDTHMDKLLRSLVIGLLDGYCADEPEVVAEARRRFELHFEDPSVLPADIKLPVYKTVLKAGGIAEYERILATYFATDNNAERKYVLNSLGATKDPALKARTLDWTCKSGDVKTQDFFYAIGPVGDSPAGAKQTWAYFQENIEFFKEKLSKASPSLLAAVVVYSVHFCSLERAAEVEAFFEKNPLPSCSRRIAQLVESIRNSGNMLNAVRDSPLASAAYWQ